MISKSVLARLGVAYEQCHERLVTDSYKKVHPPVGKIDLRWHETNKAKSFLETFFVVESMNPSVVLGGRAILDANQGKEHEIHTLGLKRQTAGMDSNSIANRDIARSLETESP